MAMIANLQYGWTLFVNPIADKYHWSKAAIQVAFTIFILTETWLVPIEGWAVDKFGPRPVVLWGEGVPVDDVASAAVSQILLGLTDGGDLWVGEHGVGDRPQIGG